MRIRSETLLCRPPRTQLLLSLISSAAPSTLIAGSQGQPEVKAESSEERRKDGVATGRNTEVRWKEFLVLNQVET